MTKYILTINERTQSLTKWCKECGVQYETVRFRLKAGWTPEEALEFVERPGKKKKKPRKEPEHKPREKAVGRCVFGMDAKGARALGCAIVIQAANDYRRALTRLSKKPDDSKAIGEVKALENFFRSAWFGVITDIDPEHLIYQLKQENKDPKCRPYFSRKSQGYLGLLESEDNPAVKNCTIIYKNISQ